MFNKIIAGKLLPKYLSSDYDPLFEFHRWSANLRILEIEEIKSVPGVPTSHPFIERTIGTIRREYLDRLLFFNEHDLKTKMERFKIYFNETRAHSSLEMKTPESKAVEEKKDKKVVSLNSYRWKSHCNDLYKLPMAA
ncbi:MAG: integrase core domain-containing protein [Nitrospinota bacterium]